jgi:hypothetical protein
MNRRIPIKTSYIYNKIHNVQKYDIQEYDVQEYDIQEYDGQYGFILRFNHSNYV